MSWPLARAQIVSMLEGIASSALVGGGEYGAGFTHDSSMGPDKQGLDNRAFYLRGTGHGTSPRGPMPSSRLTVTDVDLVVDYRHREDGADLDEVIGADYAALRTALLDGTGWGRPTSTIEIVGVPDGALPATIEELADENGDPVGRRMTIRVGVSHVDS